MLDGGRIVRSVCLFAARPTRAALSRLEHYQRVLESGGFEVQTTRLCVPKENAQALLRNGSPGAFPRYASLGSLSLEETLSSLPAISNDPRISFNLDLTSELVEGEHVRLLFKLIQQYHSKTFNFAYVFNNEPSSPFFPSAHYQQDGIAVGLQPTDLGRNCSSLDDWLAAMRSCWIEIAHLFRRDRDFLGIDSSIAPFGSGNSSLVHIVRRLGLTFDESVTTTTYVTMSNFIRQHNPVPVGLCGLMFPCLEDAELAAEYDHGRFSIERNMFLALHSGVGIDTYPIGIDEDPNRVHEILRLLQTLSDKYDKPLSARFVSDGTARIGERSNFASPFLSDCTVRPL